MRWRNLLHTLGTALGLALLLYQFWRSFGAVRAGSIELVCMPCALGAAVAGILMQLLQMVAWVFIMQALGSRLRMSDALQGYVVAFLPRYIPGVVWGYLGRSQWLERRGVPYRVSMMGSLLEVGGLIIIAGVAMGLYWLAQLASPWGTLLPLLLLVAATALWGWTPAGIAFVTRRLPDRLARRWRNAHLSASLVLANRPWFKAGVVYVLFWAVYGASIALLGKALGTTPDLSLSVSTFAATASWLIGFLILFVPAGMGVRELALTTLLVNYAGLPTAPANAIAVLARIVTLVAEFTWLLVALVLFWGSKRVIPTRRSGD